MFFLFFISINDKVIIISLHINLIDLVQYKCIELVLNYCIELVLYVLNTSVLYSIQVFNSRSM